jgi:hypothetical protein
LKKKIKYVKYFNVPGGVVRRIIFIVVVAFVMFVMAGTGVAYSQSVQKDIQAQLMLKIVGLDRNVGRFGDPVKFGVTSDAMLRALKRFSKRTIKGKAFSVQKMNTLDDISSYDVLYIDKNWKANYKTACEMAIKKKAIMFCASAQAVEIGEAGAAFKMVLGKPKIVLNLEVLKKQASDFPSGLLQLATVFGSM